MPNLKELVDNVVLALSGNTQDQIWFSNIDLKYAFLQMKLSEEISRQSSVITVIVVYILQGSVKNLRLTKLKKGRNLHNSKRILSRSWKNKITKN